jgi:cytochrome d ubiquinol oxidase subunit I
MIDFWAVALSPVAVNKFFHTVISTWVLGSVFVIGISSWFLLKKRDTEFALDSIRIATIVGFVSILLTWYTGHGSSQMVAEKQPMKLAAMEGLYEGGNGIGMVAAGILTPGKQYNDSKDPFVFNIAFPKLLSYLIDFNPDSYVPGVNNIIRGDYDTPQGRALSVEEKIRRGKIAITALGQYSTAKDANNSEAMRVARQQLDENFAYFGYGYFNSPADVIPNIPLTFYSFRIMIILGGFFLLLFILIWYYTRKNKFEERRWLQWVCLFSIPLVYICSQAGWIVAEVGRQPWAIQDILPVQAAISNLETAAVQLTFFIFLGLFTTLLIADIGIMAKHIKGGPEKSDKKSENNENS